MLFTNALDLAMSVLTWELKLIEPAHQAGLIVAKYGARPQDTGAECRKSKACMATYMVRKEKHNEELCSCLGAILVNSHN
jgi:hypothetical protein